VTPPGGDGVDRGERHDRLRESGVGDVAVTGTGALLDLAVETAIGVEGEADIETAGPPVRSQWNLVSRRFLRHKLAVVSLLVLLLFGALAIFADAVSPYDWNPPLSAEQLAQAREPPSLEHPFGTDKLGRDQFSRVLHALQKSLLVGLGAAGLSVFFGLIVGALAGFYGGWIDQLLMRFTDLVLVLPGLAVLLILAKNPDPSFFGLFDVPPATEVGGMIIILALLGWMPMARIVRGEFLSLREKEYVEAARAAGASGPRIILRHLLPNMVGAIIVFGTLEVGLAILDEATLSFLGFGIQLPDVSLGNMISDASGEVGTKLAYLVIYPGLVLFLIVLAVNFVGDGLRDALDPRAVR
jgi:peptide/nickel transport system permease protein